MEYTNKILLSIRKNANKTQAAMSIVIGVPLAHIVNYEAGVPCRSDEKITKWVRSVS